jgi:hypothetical protein
MDGSAVVIPSAKPPAGLAREDALFRIVYYGEALRAMTEHVSDSLISGPCVPMIEMLDEAFDTLSRQARQFRAGRIHALRHVQDAGPVR